MTTPASPSRYYVVQMTTSFASLDEVRERAAARMAEHIEMSRLLHAHGVLVMAGAFLDHPGEPVATMGILTSREAAEDYARNDPFVRAGEVASWTIREWANIFGSEDV
jgi:uncharacterized protein YciI